MVRSLSALLSNAGVSVSVAVSDPGLAWVRLLIAYVALGVYVCELTKVCMCFSAVQKELVYVLQR